MEFAIAIPTDADSWRVVRRAEELGFARAWFYDTQMLSADPFVAMAAAAIRTTRIRLGTGVLIPSNRIAPVAANAFASLNKLAPGRIDFRGQDRFYRQAGDGAGCGQARRAGGIYPRCHGAAARGDSRGRVRKEKAADPAAQPRTGADQHARSDPAPDRGFRSRTRALTAKLGAGWIAAAGDVEGAVAALADMRKH